MSGFFINFTILHDVHKILVRIGHQVNVYQRVAIDDDQVSVCAQGNLT